MITPQKKKIYIGVISFCLLGTLGVFIWSRLEVNTVTTPVEVLVIPSASTPGLTAFGKGNFGTPLVFPNDTKFDVSVLESGNFKSLQSYQNLSIQPQELGKDDPFKK